MSSGAYLKVTCRAFIVRKADEMKIAQSRYIGAGLDVNKQTEAREAGDRIYP